MAIINDISGNDNLTGTEQNDQIYSSAGNETVIAGSGRDSLVGASDGILAAPESGDNSVFYDSKDGIDAITDFSTGKDSVVTSKVNKIYGTPGDDSGNKSLIGTKQADEIYGYEGNDEIYGDAGNDKIYGGADNDTVYGDAGNDKIYGGAGNDTLIGGLGKDYLVGGSGNDTLTGGEGKDTFVLYYSGGGIDTLTDYTLGTDSISITSAPNRSLTDQITLGSTRSAGIEPPDKYLSYNPANGNLYYMEQKLALLPPGLDASQVIGDIIG